MSPAQRAKVESTLLEWSLLKPVVYDASIEEFMRVRLTVIDHACSSFALRERCAHLQTGRHVACPTLQVVYEMSEFLIDFAHIRVERPLSSSGFVAICRGTYRKRPVALKMFTPIELEKMSTTHVRPTTCPGLARSCWPSP